ncbi:MAG: HAD family phosphatase [Ruminococcus sp.]|nr:HAD family phosphatase [Ruminococcus sp.]
MEHHTLQGVIFDLDGTLLDSTGMWSQIDRKLLQHYHREIPPDISETVRHMSIEESSGYFIDRFKLPCTTDAFAKLAADFAREAYFETLPLKPHAVKLLDWLDENGIRYGVATATYRELAQVALKRLGIWERLAFLLTEQEVGAPKTQPQIFREGAARLHLGRRQVTVAEDSLHAVETAKAAGFFTVGVYDPVSKGDWAKMQATATVHVTDLWEMRRFF